MKLFSFIIVTRNSEDIIDRCLTSIFHFTDQKQTEIIVIDNNSKDSTQALLLKKEGMEVIINTDNKGFSFACHQGFEKSNGEFLIFLNPDTELTNTFIDTIPSIFSKDVNLGVLGPQLQYFDGTIQESVRCFPDVVSQFLMFLKVDHIFKNIPIINHYLMKDFNYSQSSYVDQVMGACFITTRRLWKLLEGFDRKFFIWFEEVDYCYRARALGYKTLYKPLGPVKHVQGKSFSQVATHIKQRWFLKSMLYYFLKNGLWSKY